MQNVAMSRSDERSINELIDAVPWGRLALAYGFALDAPTMLRSQNGATDVDQDFVDWLFGAVVHQGTPYSGTGPVLWLMHRIVELQPGHPSLGSCLGAVAECMTALTRFEEGRANDTAERSDGPDLYRNPDGDPPWASVMPAGYDPPPMMDNKVPDDYFRTASPDPATLRSGVYAWEPTISSCLLERTQLDSAIEAASAMVNLSSMGPIADALASLAADSRAGEHHRAGALFALVRANCDQTDVGDGATRSLRFAMAMGDPARPGSLAVLVDALADLQWLSTTFPRGLPGAEPWLIPAVVTAVIGQVRVDDADDAVVQCLAGVLERPSGPLGATYEWGPVLIWAFPERVQVGVVQTVPPPDSVTETQRRLLAALVRNEKVWTPKSGNDSLALRRVGLPHDRTAIANLLKP